MKSIIIKKVEIRNFKATASQTLEVSSGGVLISGHNGSGKSTTLQAIIFCLGGNMEAVKIINQNTKAMASVSLTVEHQDGLDTFTRTLTPTLSESGKVTASTSSYSISGHPKKQTEYQTAISQLFGTKDWIYLLRPETNVSNKDARNVLLAVAGAPSERDFLVDSNPALASVIGSSHFADFEKQEKAKVEAIGKKIAIIPGKIEELSSMVENVEELDLTGVSERIAAINADLKGIDQTNAERADQYNKVASEAQSLRNQANQLRNQAATLVAEANKAVNKQVYEAEKLFIDWQRTRSDLRRQIDQVKSEIASYRLQQESVERRLADANATIQTLAERCKTVAGWKPTADGMCKQCKKWCADLQAEGLQAAIEHQQNQLDETKQQGRETVARRDKLQAEIEAINKKIDGLQAMEHEVETRFNALGEAPKAPLRKVVESTEESRNLEIEADKLEKQAAAIIQGNRLDVTSHPAELVEELAKLNETITRGTAIAQTRKNSEKIQARIEELREEEKQLRLTQLKHKQNLAQLADFYRNYADSVTAMVNGLFDGTGYEIRLFESNMSNEKGTPVMHPMKAGSSNLSTAENLIFWKLFAERVLAPHYGVTVPMLIDNAEGIDSIEKLRSNHQVIAARVERHELTIENI